MPTMFDPLQWLHSKDVTVSLDKSGEIELFFNEYTNRETRERIKRVIARYYTGLLKMQLDVPPGTRPRTVQQLRAAGRLKIVEGKYRLVR